ncbi:uncharacterized protein LOC135076993 [Ostrinia nubilalis]|uniref:uncharacterized protein LOC135076993 n=1 Tax=Ostrinia nubilalis TaxID=29057 RepID=UPI00308252C6
MMVDGYKYCKETTNSGETRWVCSVNKIYNCLATIYVYSAGNNILKLNEKHNHTRDHEGLKSVEVPIKKSLEKDVEGPAICKIDTVASIAVPETTPLRNETQPTPSSSTTSSKINDDADEGSSNSADGIIFKTRLGKQAIKIGKHRFDKDYEMNKKVFWRCNKKNKGCKAYVSTFSGVVMQCGSHNHE